MSTPIRTYVQNLLAGRNQIYKIYETLDKIHANRLLKFCYNAKFNGLPFKVYNNKQLSELERLADCQTMASLVNQAFNNGLTTDLYITLLIKARPTILKLYQARTKALYMKSTIRNFCYMFINPFGTLAGVTSNCLCFNSANKFINFYCAINGTFDPLLVFGGLL